MPFIGNQPALSYTSFAKQDFSTSATTSYTLDNPVTNANELALFINFVRQEPTTAYTASGTTLTLTSATSASDDMYCVYLGKAVQTVNPPNASVGTSQLADNGVTTAKIANDAVTKDKVSNLMYPAFEAKLSATQSLSDNVATKIQFDTENFDTDNCYDNTTNYRFTPTTAGKYFIYGKVTLLSASDNALKSVTGYIYKNGTSINSSFFYFWDNFIRGATANVSSIVDMNGSTDYVEFFGNIDVNTGSVTGASSISTFGGYRIGD